MSPKAVFLDRDGVLNDNQKPVNRPEDLILFPWAAPAVARLNFAGFFVFIVTNQGGIELGYLAHSQLEAIHEHLLALLRKENAVIDGIAYCPHFHQQCSCRKPRPGMLLELSAAHHIQLTDSWMIGDREEDIRAGNSAGCRTIKLGEPVPHATYTCGNLAQAVEYILGARHGWRVPRNKRQQATEF